MIKRPLCWIFTAFLIGLYLAWLKLSVTLIITLILLMFLAVYLLMFRIKNNKINHKDSFLWGLPVLLLAGFLVMNDKLEKPELYTKFDEEQNCELHGEITKVVEKQNGFALYVKDNRIILENNETYLCENVIVNYFTPSGGSDPANLIPTVYCTGNHIKVEGILKKFSNARNPGGFDEQTFYRIENIDFKVEAKRILITDPGYSVYHAVLDRIKNKLEETYELILPGKEAGTLIAMLLGDKDLLDEEIRKLYQENGISHILAISGLHISLLGMFLYSLLKKLKCPVLLTVLLTILFVYSYGVLTDFSVSTNRAVVMMTISLMAPVTGKTYDMLSSLSLCALIILLQNPLQLLSAGFLLSFGAVLGIAVIYPYLHQLFPSKNALIQGLMISISAQTATTPIILSYFYRFPTYGCIINLIILPLITLLTLTSILGAIAGAICLPIGVFIIGGANYILKFYEWVCRLGSNLPKNQITVGKPDFLRILLYFTLVVLFLWTAQKYKKRSSVIIIAAATFLLLLPHKNAGLEINFLDVGQGDAITIESRDRTTYLIDGGSADVKKIGEYRLLPFFLSKGIDCLDYAVVTHSDKDHISGLLELMELKEITIKNLILPDISGKDDAFLGLENLARKKEIPISYIKAGDVIGNGKLLITCLHPYAGYQAPDNNSYSTVLSVTYGSFDLLLTGDLQKDGEELVTELLEDQNFRAAYGIRPASDYDVLKVAHHGSKYSTFEKFLALTQPEIAVISCGKDNFYGHPHEELLERLKQTDRNVRITYDTGAITVITDGKELKINDFLNFNRN